MCFIFYSLNQLFSRYTGNLQNSNEKNTLTYENDETLENDDYQYREKIPDDKIYRRETREAKDVYPKEMIRDHDIRFGAMQYADQYSMENYEAVDHVAPSSDESDEYDDNEEYNDIDERHCVDCTDDLLYTGGIPLRK